MKEFKDSLVSGFAWQASTKLFVQIFSWISTIWVARLLVPEDYGLVAMSGIVTGVFLMLATSGLAAGIVNRKEIAKQELDTVFWLSVIMGIGLYALVYLISDPASAYFEAQKLSEVIKVAGLMVVFSSLKLVPCSIALRNLDYKMISLTEMAAAFIGIATTFILAILQFNYWSLVLGTLSAELFTVLVYFIYYQYLPNFKVKFNQIRDLLRFGGTLLLSRALSFVSNNIPLFYLSSFTTANITGQFQMANTFANLPSSKIGILFSNLIFPAMSRIKEDQALMRSTFVQMHTSLLFVTAPMFIGLALISEPLIHVVLTEAWYPIISPFRVICIIAILKLSSLFITRAIEGLGDAKVSLNYQVLMIVVYGPSLWFGVTNWGLNGLLLAWVSTSPILYIYLLRKIAISLNLKVKELVSMFMPITLCILVMSVSVTALMEFIVREQSYIIQLISAAICGVVTFSGAAFVLARPYVDKVRLIINDMILKRKLRNA